MLKDPIVLVLESMYCEQQTSSHCLDR